MRKRFAPVVALATGALALTGAAAGGTHATMRFTATLNAGQEVPHPVGTKAGASGAAASVSSSLGSMPPGVGGRWPLSTIASAPSLFALATALCGPCTSGQKGKGTVTSAQLAQMKAGKTYVNVHTAKNPGGEIRGQLVIQM